MVETAASNVDQIHVSTQNLTTIQTNQMGTNGSKMDAMQTIKWEQMGAQWTQYKQANGSKMETMSESALSPKGNGMDILPI